LNRPVSSRIFSKQTSVYSNISGAKSYGHGVMPKAEEILASHLSPDTASFFKGLVHPKMKILSVFTHPHVVPTT